MLAAAARYLSLYNKLILQAFMAYAIEAKHQATDLLPVSSRPQGVRFVWDELADSFLHSIIY